VNFGIHLPQYGRAAGAESIGRAAEHAESLGFADVWVSDHLAVPTGAPYPSPFLFEPLMTLSWAAARTSRVRLATGILVLPYRHPLHLAKEVASLDVLSGGRVLLGIGAGWLEGEFEALNIPFAERGPRTDEALAALRACWEQRPTEYVGEYFKLHDLQVLPQPAQRVPVWSGGSSHRALRRAATSCEGWQSAFAPPDEISDVVVRLKEARAGTDFTVSVRLNWDGLAGDLDLYRSELERYASIGVDHVFACPLQGSLDGWLKSVELLHEVFVSVGA
jgi:probable F420-dependent oxidoreductase